MERKERRRRAWLDQRRLTGRDRRSVQRRRRWIESRRRGRGMVVEGGMEKERGGDGGGGGDGRSASTFWELRLRRSASGDGRSSGSVIEP